MKLFPSVFHCNWIETGNCDLKCLLNLEKKKSIIGGYFV